MRKGSPGRGFLGKTNNVLTDLYSSEIPLSVVESCMVATTWPLLPDERSLWQAVQLNIKEINKNETSERI
jgi:hypothetical protein